MKPTEPNDAKMMKITKKEKEFILSQVQIVLSECQQLVSQLSQVQCQEEDCPDDDVSSISSQQSHDLLWDTSEDFPVYTAPTPSVFYNLVYTEEELDEEIFSELENCQIPKKSLVKECSFVNKINAFISSNFPDNVFSKERSEQLNQKRLDESIIPEFQCLLQNVGDLFIQNPEPNEICTTTTPTSEIVFKTIDFSRVNVRNMANIPKPNYFPIHGVSNDPEFYKKTHWVKGFEYDKKEINYFKPAPHGSKYGYQTNDGIVPVPDSPVHGHVWSHHAWRHLNLKALPQAEDHYQACLFTQWNTKL